MKPINKFYLSISTVIVLTISSCSTNKTGVKEGVAPPGNQELQYNAYASTVKSWSDVSVPVTFSLNKPTDITISGRMRMVRNQGVDISLRMLGIEMARIMVARDSVFASYRLKKICVAEPISAGSNVPALLGNLQDVMLGRTFVLGQVLPDGVYVPDFNNYDCEITNNRLALTPKGISGPDFVYAFFVNDDNRLETLVALAPKKGSLEVKYEGFVDTLSGLVPSTDLVTAALGNMEIDAKIHYKWSSAKWNDNIGLLWSAPRGYKQVTLNELMSEIVKQK